MLKLLRIILAITVMSLAGYALITEDYTIQPYMMLFECEEDELSGEILIVSN